MIALLFLILYYFSSNAVIFKQEEFSGIIDNWKSDLIWEFGKGPNIWSGSYPGTVAGCQCFTTDTESEVYYGINRHACSYNETRAGCIDINPIPRTLVSRWKNSESLRYTRLANTSFAELHVHMNADGSCKQGNHLCGTRGQDQGGICIPDDLKGCPVNELVLEQKIADGDSQRLIQLDSSIFFGNQRSDMDPVVDLEISESRVCLNPREDSFTPGRKYYTLMSGRMNKCVNDSRYMALDSMGESEFLEINKVPVDRLPEFVPTNKYQWIRFYRRLLSWKHTCLEEVPQVIEVFEAVKSTSSSYGFQFWVCLALLLVISGLQIYSSMLIEAAKPPTTIRRVYHLRLAIILCMGALFVRMLLHGYPLSRSVQRISERRCGDPLTQTVIAGSSHVLYFDYTLFGLIALGLWVAVAALDNIETMWNRLRADYSKRTAGMPVDLARIEDDMGSFLRFVAVLSSIS